MTDPISTERTRNYISQIKGSVVFKALAVAASFLAIPLMIRYLGQEQFGVWTTLLSVMSWVVFFDLGVGNGLRYKVAESLAKNEVGEAASFISSAYGLIGLVSLGSFLLVASATFFIPWQSVFNTQAISETTLRYTVLSTTFFVLLNFWIGLINQIVDAVQRSSVVVLGQFVTNGFTLALVWILSQTTTASILLLAVAHGISMVIAYGGMSFWFFSKRKDLRPKRSIDERQIRPLLSLGGQFFLIQLAVLVLFATDKILVTQLMGPEHVTQYEVVFKLFGIITLVFSLIAAPLLPAYSDAYHRHDFVWIRNVIKKLLITFGIGILGTTFLALLSKTIIRLWIGTGIDPPFSLIISMGAFVLIFAWSGIFSYVLNAAGKIKMQMYLAIFSMVVNIPLAILLIRHYGMGSSGVVLANCICMLPFAVLGPMQVHGILRKNPNCVETT